MSDPRINLTFFYRNHLDEVNDYTLEFASIPDFKNYLRWEPEKAMLIGYGKVDEDRVRASRTSNVVVAVATDGLWFGFYTARGFADFLGWNHSEARKLQWTKRKKN
jgi:hypothetical protein